VLSISGTTHTLYLDGSAVNVNPGQANFFNTYSTITNAVIGAQSVGLTQAFKGLIGDVRVYNYAISASQVSSLYLNRNLVIHYPFDTSVNKMTPNYGTMLYDASMVGSLSMTTGLVGTNALSLTNSSGTGVAATQYIKSSPKNWLLNSTSTGLTISCWVNTSAANTGKIMRLFDIPISKVIDTGLVVDISGSNMIYSGYSFSNLILITSFTTTTAKSAGFTQIPASGVDSNNNKITNITCGNACIFQTNSRNSNLFNIYLDDSNANSYISLPNLTATNGISITFMLYINGPLSSGPIFSLNGTYDNTNINNICMFTHDAGSLRVSANSTTVTALTLSVANLSLNPFFCSIVVKKNVTNSIFKINNNSSLTLPSNNPNSNTAIFNGTTPVTFTNNKIGANSTFNYQPSMQFYLSNFRIYNYGLSDADVSNLYDNSFNTNYILTPS
jgi:hypothetical protein